MPEAKPDTDRASSSHRTKHTTVDTQDGRVVVHWELTDGQGDITVEFEPQDAATIGERLLLLARQLGAHPGPTAESIFGRPR